MDSELHCTVRRAERQTSVIPSSSRPEATDKASIELTQPWTNALTATLQQGIQSVKQSGMDQQQPVLCSKHESRVWSLLFSYAWAVGRICCHHRAVMSPEKEVKQMSRARRLSSTTVQAHENTLQYEQVMTGCLMQAQIC